ncbi:MAG: DUF4127 family protein [Armatimonadetes bacterium]|nr:DUF4127 family protein [Armatimonadota bacterium]
MSLRHRTHRILYVPLDDRPCNAKWPRLLARIVDFDLIMPPAEMLGRYNTPGNPSAIADWLMRSRGRIDAAVLSLDMLAYGGLVASRTSMVPLETAEDRLGVLAALRDHLADASIFAFNVIMRLSITADSAQSAQYWQLMREWTELSYQVHTLGREELAENLRGLERTIPAEIRDGFEAVRRRNHAINMRAVDYVASGAIDYLALTQEDAAEYGPHIPEQQRLREMIAEHELEERVSIHPGADEAGLVLLARFINKHMLRSPTVRVAYSSQEGAQRIATFEDRPVRETVKAQISAVGAYPAEEGREPDLNFLVATPAEGQRSDYERGPARDQRQEELRALLQRGAELGRHLVLCDVGFPNGADELLMRELRRSDIELHRLMSFAAWNTAGNSIGSALAHGTLRLIALQDKGAFDLAQLVSDIPPMRYLELLNSLIDSERAHVELLLGRFVDDWLYQTRVRPAVTRHVVDMLQASTFNLADSYRQTEQMVAEQLGVATADLWAQHFLARETVQIGVQGSRSSLVLAALEETLVTLPWRRMFEVDLSFRFGVELVAEGD